MSIQQRTLLLNASMEPISVITWKRAIVLLMEDKADVVAESDQVLHSPSMEMYLPEVIRLRKYANIPFRRNVVLTRKSLLIRDNDKCAYCGGTADTIDHVHPRSLGGEHKWTNVVAACKRCNNSKSDRLLEDIGWTLPFDPISPSRESWILYGIRTPPESWLPYLDIAKKKAITHATLD